MKIIQVTDITTLDYETIHCVAKSVLTPKQGDSDIVAHVILKTGQVLEWKCTEPEFLFMDRKLRARDSAPPCPDDLLSKIQRLEK